MARELTLDSVHNRVGHVLGPRFKLEIVRKAAEEDRLELMAEGPRSRGISLLLGYFDDILACRRFALEVVKSLQVADFCETRTINGTDYDEYGLQLPESVCSEYGLIEATWYLKLRLEEGSFGEVVLVFSMHPLERNMVRMGGKLRVVRRASMEGHNDE